jgi:integrase
MSIDRLPSGKHRVRVHVGEGRYKSKSFTRKRDAERWEQDMTAAKETGRVATMDADLQTLRSLASEHMNAARPDLAARTWTSYVGMWDRNVRQHDIADLPLRGITPEQIENFRDDLRTAGVGEQSILRTMKLLQTILERAVRFGRIPSNPVKAVKKPRATRSTDARPITPEKVEAIRAELKGANAVFVSVLAYGGLRPGEARGLTWGDIGDRTIRVRGAVDPDGVDKATKTTKSRSVRLLAPLAEDLVAWRTASGNPSDAALIFPRSDGRAWTETDYRNFARRPFRKAASAAGVDIGSPYDLRHSAASLWLHEGINAVQVAAWMGHSPAMLLSTYAHVIAEVDPDDRSSAVDMIRKARGHDISVTSIGVRPGLTAVKRSAA